MSLRPKSVWQMQSTHPHLIESVDEAFRQVMDPEIGLNIMELGLIRDVSINDNKAHIIMVMTTPFCPYAGALLENARMRAENILGFDTTIEMGMEMWDPSYMEEDVGADWGLF